MLVLGLLGGCARSHDARDGVARSNSVTSNLLRGDYVGSATCGDCHAKIYEAWEKSPMRNMTRDATGVDPHCLATSID